MSKIAESLIVESWPDFGEITVRKLEGEGEAEKPEQNVSGAEA